MKATVCGKVKDISLYTILIEIAQHMDRVERLYFRERYIHGKDRNGLKRTFIKDHGITGRQLNGVIFNLGGKVDSAHECLIRNLETTKTKLVRVEKKLKTAFKSKKKNLFKIHQYKRQITNFKHKVSTLESQVKSGIPSICFGSRSLFQKQFELKENGYSTHAEWQKDWKESRSSQFYCLGSKDESFGNQTCQLLPQGLQVRLPDCLAVKYGKYITVPVVFPHGDQILKDALLSGQAISYLFIHKEKGWYVHA